MYEQSEVMIVREISAIQAKKEIYDLIKSRNRIFYSEISELLHLDIRTVVELCDELESDRKIEGAEECQIH